MPGHDVWIKKSQSDLKMAKKGLKDDDDTLDCVVYHAHQCAEKVLKGYYIFKGKPADRTHDLEYLLKMCCEFDSVFINLKNDIKILNSYGLHSRYPDDRFIVNRKEAEESFKIAEKIMKFVLKKVSEPETRQTKIF
jgi:HEPN domain-containing protein